jgi:C-terminal processing protease CtpA/Prc
MTIIAPPGKLGIILANRADSRGTVVSGVRTSSVMAEQISPGDRIVAIDGEDVSLMTVSEITTIMTRNVEFERTLTVLTTPRHAPSLNSGEPPMSPRSSSDYDYLHGK